MSENGIIQSIDNLGRIVIPKEIREVLNVVEGSAIKIYANRNTVWFRKHIANKTSAKREQNNKFKSGDVVVITVNPSLMREIRGRIDEVRVTGEGYVYKLEGRSELWSESVLRSLSLKEQLQEFAIVRLRDGVKTILLSTGDKYRLFTKEMLVRRAFCSIKHESYSDELCYDQLERNDVMAFANFKNHHDAIATLIQGCEIEWDWEREENKQMTQSEIEEELGHKIEIVKED